MGGASLASSWRRAARGSPPLSSGGLFAEFDGEGVTLHSVRRVFLIVDGYTLRRWNAA